VKIEFTCPACRQFTVATVPDLTHDEETATTAKASIFCSNDNCMAEYEFGPAA
jgi:hypothetical protein